VILRSTDIAGALRARQRRAVPRQRQRGFIMNPFAMAPSGDTLWSSVGLLLHFDGTNGSTTVTDSGPLGKTVARSGSSGSISTSQSVFGGSSWQGGANTVVNVSTPYASGSSLQSSNWTFECRYRRTSTSQQHVLLDTNNSGTNNTGWAIYVETTGSLNLYSGSQGVNYGGFGAMTTNTWYALRVVWNGATLYFFIDGTLVGSNVSATFNNTFGGSFALFNNSSATTQSLQGFVDELRWTKAVRSTASYTVLGTAFGPSVVG
jgi:hypothetical protein